MVKGNLIFLVIISVFLGITLNAQEPDTLPTPPPFEGVAQDEGLIVCSTEMLLVNVAVSLQVINTHLENLKPEDFRVYYDDKLQAIEFFTEVGGRLLKSEADKLIAGFGKTKRPYYSIGTIPELDFSIKGWKEIKVRIELSDEKKKEFPEAKVIVHRGLE